MTWYIVAAIWFALSVVFGVLAGRYLEKISPPGYPRVPSCCPPGGGNTRSNVQTKGEEPI